MQSFVDPDPDFDFDFDLLSRPAALLNDYGRAGDTSAPAVFTSS